LLLINSGSAAFESFPVFLLGLFYIYPNVSA